MSKNLKDERITKHQDVSEEHLYYEIWMLYEVTIMLFRGIQDIVVKNTMVESFGIHAAIILDFLFNNKKSDDVIANDFMSNKGAWKNVYQDRVEEFSFIFQKRHKELAHLSYKRLEVVPDEKPWHYVAITREIADLVDTFIEMADEEFLHANVRNLKGVYRNNPIWRTVPSFKILPMRKEV